MASITSHSTTLLLLLLLLFLTVSVSTSSTAQSQKSSRLSGRSLASVEEEEDETVFKAPPKKKNLSEAKKNETKLIKPKNTNSNTTDTKIKPPKSLNSTTIKTKLPKALNTTTTSKAKLNKTLSSNTTAAAKSSNSTKLNKPIKLVQKTNSSSLTKSQLKPLNSTTKPSKSPKKPSDLAAPKNKTTMASSTSNSKLQQPDVNKKSNPNPSPKQERKPKPKLDPSMSWLQDEDSDSDLITEFRDLPSRLLPDLAKISTTSKVYITKANKEMAQNFKTYVGSKYAPTVASVASSLFLVLPLLLLTLLFHKLRTYLSMQRALIFIQAYLAIYFGTLAITALLTGLEPLRFFYATSPATYACTQALQTLGYVLYLLVQLVNLVVVFSASEGGGGGRGLSLAQMVVGLAVGLHYYAAVFHRAVAGEPPHANWKVHGVYALCFLGVCALARAERRKKAYLHGGVEDGKKS